MSLKCPSCASQCVLVTATTDIRLLGPDDAIEQSGGYAYNDDSETHCEMCGATGRLIEFDPNH